MRDLFVADRSFRPQALRLIVLALIASLALTPSAALAQATVELGAGTVIYAELEEHVTSRRHSANEGDIVRARVYEDVYADDVLVIEEGARLLLRVSDARKARFLGRKGRVELEAIEVDAVDGQRIPLRGLYLETGKGRKAVTAALTFYVAWPFLFVRGRNAHVAEGTVFSAAIDRDVTFELAER